MPNLIINKTPSTTGSAGNLVIDEYVATVFTSSAAAEIFWRWEDEPETYPLFLQQQKQATTVGHPFELSGRAIRLFLVSVTADGRRSVSDVRLAEQVVFTPDPTLGILTDSGNSLSNGGDVLVNSV